MEIEKYAAANIHQAIFMWGEFLCHFHYNLLNHCNYLNLLNFDQCTMYITEFFMQLNPIIIESH